MSTLEPAPRTLRVLIVEDDPADAELVLLEIRRGGIEVEAEVVGTREALADRLRQQRFDVVLADYGLAGWTGMDVLDDMRRLGCDAPLVLVTGSLGEELAVACVKRGVADYVLKSNLARLPLAVRRALDERRALAELARAEARQQVAEAALVEREELFTQLAENISEVFYVMDAQYRSTFYISPAFERIWGVSRQALFLDPSAFLAPVPPDDRDRLIASIALVQQGQDPGPIEFRVVHPDGEVRWVLSHAIPLRNEEGEVHRIAGVALDVTERRRAQTALEESEARYRKLTEASFDAIDLTMDGVILEVNRGFLEMFGYDSESEVLGRPVTDFCAPESLEMVRGRVEDSVEGTYELVAQCRDGRRITLEATARTHTIEGRPGRLTALRDVTEKRILEEQFRQAQKMEAVGRLAGGVAHDFNNLLTVITTFAGLLAEDLAPDDPRRESVTEIRQAADRAADLTRQLLAFSRQQVIQPRSLHLGQVVTDSTRMLKRLIGEDVLLETVIGPEPVPVVMDPGQLEQVIMNLAINSRDAMPTGGRLTLETAAVELDEAYADSHWPVKPGRYALLAVTDTGSGMGAEIRARIFEPFFTTKEPGRGTGLGLATVYGIVKSAGGSIWVYSEPGMGTTFKIYLPLVETTEPGRAEVGEPGSRSLSGSETVLVVEDAPAVRASVRRILERYGYRVWEAPDGEAALALASGIKEDIDLLLTDVVMPGMGGRVLAEEFGKLRPETRVLYISGYTDDAVLRHGVLNSRMPYLQKPFTAEELGRKLREVLDAE